MKNYSLGNFICELRMRRGLSQAQLGALVGVSNKAVSKWENGSAEYNSDEVFSLHKLRNHRNYGFCVMHPGNDFAISIYDKATLWEVARIQ